MDGNERELRRLNRRALLEIMLNQARELDVLKKERDDLIKELDETKAALKRRDIDIDEAGSIAVAALQINGIFEVAQAASQQYIDNIKRLSDRQEAICAKRDEESRSKSEALLKETEERCRELEAEARQEAEAYWEEVYQRLQLYFENHQELKRLLNFGIQ